MEDYFRSEAGDDDDAVLDAAKYRRGCGMRRTS